MDGMTPATRPFPAPSSAVVVGAGIVGLSTALFLRRAGLDVTVVEADRVAAGASWGNAGWVTPPLATPLPEPAILAYGLRALTSPDSPLYVPLRPDPRLLRFLTGFARRSTGRAWRRAMRSYVPVNVRAHAAFEALAEQGLPRPTDTGPGLLAAFTDDAGRRTVHDELSTIRAVGQPVELEELTGAEARALVPGLSDAVVAALRLGGTSYIDPPRYLDALARAATEAGVRIREATTVLDVEGGTPRSPAAVRVAPSEPPPPSSRTPYGEDRLAPGGPAGMLTSGARERAAERGSPPGDAERVEADVVVLATGAWLGDLARPFGVRMVVQAGRGYSFTVPMDPLPTVPLYFPAQRLACTPLADRLRVAGMMEFRRPEDRLDPRRVGAMVKAARPLLTSADLDDRRDEWVGSRPVTPDGVPLIGPTRSPRVVAAGGHGMWGVTLGPLTGQLVAELVTTGRLPSELAPFDPLR